MATYYTYIGRDSAGNDVKIIWFVTSAKGTLFMGDCLVDQKKLNDIAITTVGIRVDACNGIPVIVMPNEEASYPLDGVYKLLGKINIMEYTDSGLSDLAAKLDAKFIGEDMAPSLDLWVALLKNYRDFHGPYMNGTLKVKMSISPAFITDNTVAVNEAIARMTSNASSTVEYVGNSLNQTLKQTSCSDRFYIALPEYERLIADELLEQLIPTMTDVFVPFSHPAYYGPFWMNLKDRPEAERLSYLSSLVGRADINMGPQDVMEFVDYPIESILGSDENNALPVLDNEIDYYRALIKFIEFDLKKNFPDTWETLFENGALTPHMKAYLEDLIEAILLMNWSCSGMFRIFSVDLDDSEDDSFVDRDTDSPENLTYQYHKDTNPEGYNGVEFILGWLRTAAQGSNDQNSKPLGCKVYAEAIVKLARWGDRKPRCLKLDGKDLMFNLSSFREIVPQTDFSKLYPVEVNGRELSLGGTITSQIMLRDSEYCEKVGCIGKISCPVGFITVKFFANGDSQINYVSALDVVSNYAKGNYFIDGINLDPQGKFIVDEERAGGAQEYLGVACKNVLNSADYTFHISTELEKFAQDVNAKVKVLDDLYVINVLGESDSVLTALYDKFKFSNFEQLKDIITEYSTVPLRVITINIAHNILPLYMKVTEEWEGTSISSLLNLYKEQAELLGISHSTDFYSDSAVLPASDAKSEVIVQELSMFAKPTGKDSAIMVDISPLLNNVSKEDSFIKILSMDKSRTICYVANRANPDGNPKTIFIVTAVNELPDNASIVADVFTIDKITPHVWKAFAGVMSGSISGVPQVQFVSQATATSVFAEMNRK